MSPARQCIHYSSWQHLLRNALLHKAVHERISIKFPLKIDFIFLGERRVYIFNSADFILSQTIPGQLEASFLIFLTLGSIKHSNTQIIMSHFF
jgi:hypothetical protein